MMHPTKIERLRKLIRRQWITPLIALNECGLLSLSQRVGQLRREGLTIIDKWVIPSPGTRVKAYRCVRGAQ